MNTVYIKKHYSQQKKRKNSDNFLLVDSVPEKTEIIPTENIKNKRASQLYDYLGSLTNRKNGVFVYPSLNNMADALKCSVSTIQRAIRFLESNGFLERTERKRHNGSQTSNLYMLKKVEKRKVYFKKYATITVPKNKKMTTPYSINNSIEKKILRNSDKHKNHVLKNLSFFRYEVMQIFERYKYDLKIRGICPHKLFLKWKTNRLATNCRTKNGVAIKLSRFMQDLEFWIIREIKVKLTHFEFKKRKNKTIFNDNSEEKMTQHIDYEQENYESDLTFLLNLRQNLKKGIQPNFNELQRVRDYYEKKDKKTRDEGIKSWMWALQCAGFSKELI